MHWYIDVLKRYADFKGRASRKEYWMFVLMSAVISVGVMIIDRIILGEYTPAYIYGLYGLLVWTPSMAVLIRRLHDTGHSGWWFFIMLVPLVGVFILLYLMIKKGTPEENCYGPVPAASSSVGIMQVQD